MPQGEKLWDLEVEFDYSAFDPNTIWENFERTHLTYEKFIEKAREEIEAHKDKFFSLAIGIEVTYRSKIACAELFFRTGQHYLDEIIKGGLAGRIGTNQFPFENLDAQLTFVESELTLRKLIEIPRNYYIAKNPGKTHLVGGNRYLVGISKCKNLED